MKKLIIFIVTILMVHSLIIPAKAYDSYQITVSAGLHGTFDGTAIKNKLIEDNVVGENDVVIIDEKTIEITMKKGDDWNPNYFVPNLDNAKYYFKGFHESGIEGGLPSGVQEVDEDIIYVATYGVAGEMVDYLVHYVDESNRTLHETSTYKGNVGDSPVVAYLYIPGYVPLVRNQGDVVLSKDTVTEFTFVYRVATVNEIIEEQTVPSGTGTNVVPGGTLNPTVPETNPGETTEPVEPVVIDEPDTPTANPEDIPDNNDNADENQGNTSDNIFLKIAIPSLLLLLIILLFVLLRRRKDGETEE